MNSMAQSSGSTRGPYTLDIIAEPNSVWAPYQVRGRVAVDK